MTAADAAIGWYNEWRELYAENTKLRAERDRLLEVLKEVDEILTNMDWHQDRGILQRVIAAIAEIEGKANG
jgi:hypothetical protein